MTVECDYRDAINTATDSSCILGVLGSDNHGHILLRYQKTLCRISRLPVRCIIVNITFCDKTPTKVVRNTLHNSTRRDSFFPRICIISLYHRPHMQYSSAPPSPWAMFSARYLRTSQKQTSTKLRCCNPLLQTQAVLQHCAARNPHKKRTG